VLAHGFNIPFREAVPLIGSFAIIASRLLTVASSLLSKRLNVASSTPSLLLVHQLVSEGSAQERSEQGAALNRIEQDIEFRDVWFGYEGGKPVFQGLSLIIPRNKIVGIVGPSGIGKSTLGYLITRLYEPDRGSILVNNQNIQEFSIESLRCRVGYVEQQPLIFNGTIEDNIRLSNARVAQRDVVDAAKAAGIHDFILTLPEGYNTPVGDQGATLSGGERQRIAIARAIIRQPDLFIIDEGTSALDRHAEAVVQETIQKLCSKASVILIAHRISTLENADLIYELLPDGKAVVRTFEEVAA
jgi:ABC-type multidrug transport system fused ATPase/permease subunit